MTPTLSTIGMAIIKARIAAEKADRLNAKLSAAELTEAFAYLSQEISESSIQLITALATQNYTYERVAAGLRALKPGLGGNESIRAATIAAYTKLASTEECSLDHDALKETVQALEGDGRADAIGVLCNMARAHKIAIPSPVLEALVRTGSPDAVNKIQYAPVHRITFDDSYSQDINQYRVQLLKQIGSEEALDAIAKFCSYSSPSNVRYCLKALAESGEKGLNRISHMATTGTVELAAVAYQFMSQIDTDAAQARMIEIEGLFQERLADLDNNINEMKKLEKPWIHRPREIPYKFSTLLDDLKAYSAADPVTAMNTLCVAAFKAQAHDAALLDACQYIRTIYNAHPEYATHGREILCSINTQQAKDALFANITDEESAYQVVRQAIYMNNHPSNEVNNCFRMFPGLEDRIASELDLEDDTKSLNAALCLSNISDKWNDLLFTQLEQFPEPWALEEVYKKLNFSTGQTARDFIETLGAIQSPAASAMIVSYIERSHDRALGEIALEELANSAQDGVHTHIYLVARASGNEEEGVRTLFALRSKLQDEGMKRLYTEAMLPLIKVVADPANLHKKVGQMGDERRSELARIFADVDRAHIVASARPHHFSNLFRSITEQCDQRVLERVSHDCLFKTPNPAS